MSDEGNQTPPTEQPAEAELAEGGDTGPSEAQGGGEEEHEGVEEQQQQQEQEQQEEEEGDEQQQENTDSGAAAAAAEEEEGGDNNENENEDQGAVGEQTEEGEEQEEEGEEEHEEGQDQDQHADEENEQERKDSEEAEEEEEEERERAAQDEEHEKTEEGEDSGVHEERGLQEVGEGGGATDAETSDQQQQVETGSTSATQQQQVWSQAGTDKRFEDVQELTEDHSFMDQDPEELEKMLEEKRKKVRHLELEQEIFESYLRRHVDPNEDLFAQSGEESKKSWRKKRGRKQKGPTTLTIDQKLEIASSELDHYQKENQSMDKKYTQMIETLKAVLEQTNIRIRELEKEGYEFRRDIVQGAENPRTGKIMAEKVTKYFEDKLRAKDALVEKLRLKNTSLRNSIKKAETQLRQKEEMGDVLHYIDFHQLQIENKQYLQKIEEKNQQLLHLKMSTGQTVQTLNALKHRLNTLLQECSWRKQEISTRSELLQRLKQENEQVENEIKKGESQVHSLSGQLSATENLPRTMDYVEQKEKMQYLEKELSSWERKLEISEMALKRARGLYKKAIRTAESFGLKITDEGHTLSASTTWASGTGHSMTRSPAAPPKQNSRVGLTSTPFGKKTPNGLYKGASLSSSLSRNSTATEKR